MPLIPQKELKDTVAAILVAVGADRDNARCVSDSLVEANLAGHDSHGVMKLLSYIRDIRAGGLHPAVKPTVVTETPATAVIDGEGGFGHVAAAFAADLAAVKALQVGIAGVAVAHAHHTGRLGGWSERIARRSLIAMLVGSEAQPPYKVAPHDGATGALSTNPITWALPRAGGRPPILLDYATSMVSIGKLQATDARGAPIPADWILDAHGQPSTKLGDFFADGALLPFGTYKGYALSVIAELLAVGLSGGRRFAPDRSSCLYVIAVDPARSRPPGEFEAYVELTVERLKSVAPREPGGEVLIPGEPEERSRRALAAGVMVPDTTWNAVRALADTLGVDMPTDARPPAPGPGYPASDGARQGLVR